jgi:hypothetical protein
MEEKVVDMEKATSRRSRKDEEGRDFQCGCGKRYLSYPALYTHIKTKHDGRQPEGTLKTGATQLTKRAKGKLEEELLRSITAYFHKEELRLFTELPEGVAGAVQLSARIRKDALPRETYDSYLALMKEKEVRLQSTSSLDLALTVYLVNVGFHVNDKVYEQFLSFARLARHCFSDHGEEVYRAYFARKEQGGPFALAGFAGNEVRFFPIVADFLVQSYIPLEAREANLSLMELLTFDFCNWLYNRRLTNIRVTMGNDFKLDYKPIPTPAKQKGTPSKHDTLR